MKLFTPIEVNKQKENQISATVKRIETVEQELARKSRALEKLNLEFEIALERQTMQFEKDKAENQQICNSLLKEVSELEERKRQALIPLSEKWEVVTKLEDKLKKEVTKFQKKNEAIDRRLECLEEKLSDVGDKELILFEIAQKQNSAQIGIDQQKAQIALQAKQINEAIQSTTKKQKEQQDAILKATVALELRERTLESEKEKYKKKDTELANRERALQDKYATLERTIQRIKK